MDVRDLGALDGDVILFGGPTSNLQAFEALLSEAEARGIPASRIISTGDLVAYAADGAGVVERVRDLGCHVVAGNCEKELAAGSADCGCGFDEGSTCAVLADGWFAHARRTLNEEHRAYLGACPDRIVFRAFGKRVVVIHGAATRINRFLWPVTAEADLEAELSVLEDQVGPFDVVVAGHSGLAFQRPVGNRLWVNTGSLGMPENDGDTATRFVVMTEAGFETVRLTYDHAAAATAMTAAGLSDGYDVALLTGYWPSEDVLPAELRRAS